MEEADIAGGAMTGFKFGPGMDETLAGALRRASNSFHDKQVWRKLQLNGMLTDVSWRNRASQYAALYHDAVAIRRN
jgi:starch synthase